LRWSLARLRLASLHPRPTVQMNSPMTKDPDFTRSLAHSVRSKGDPGVLFEALEDAARFIGLMEPWRQARAYWDRCAGEILKAAKTGKRSDIVEATRSLEEALRRENWL